MSYARGMSVDTAIGKRKTDSTGSPLGVVRMDAGRSYAGAGELLQQYINTSDRNVWARIRAKIDHTYNRLDLALAALDEETRFGAEIRSRVEEGRKILVKPNVVTAYDIDPQTHGPGPGHYACTDWPFVAALMRWLHDRLDISYHQMCVAEAATTTSAVAGMFSMWNPEGERVTTEAVIEGRAGGFYGGWGFYFVRKYLAESHDPSHWDDPMQGYEDSVAGTCIPPGHAADRLMVYDLNRIYDDPTKGRDVEVPDGVNYSSITLHKAIVGGEPGDPEDIKAYPGCVLVNVPKLKVHQITPITAAVKNLGIGLYPMEAAEAEGSFRWKYGVPFNKMPGLKAGIPHAKRTAAVDPLTGFPERDASGDYIVTESAGILATMADVITAVRSQGVFMLHVVDAVEAINLDHTGNRPGTREGEGLAVAGLDPVATDLLCARYLFSNVPLEEAYRTGIDDGNGGRFPQKVPVPRVEGDSIVTDTGYDCPLSRDGSYRYAEERGLGARDYYVVGRDAVTDTPLASVGGRLGAVNSGRFSEIITPTLYYDIFKMPWDLQQTSFGYFEAVDTLAGSSLKKEFLEAFDEDGDGVVRYDECGRKGMMGPILALMANRMSIEGTERYGYHHGSFILNSTLLRLSNPQWNAGGHDITKHFFYGVASVTAYAMSQLGLEGQDPFLPTLTWGKGKWPSFQFASYMQVGVMLCGDGFPLRVGAGGLYGHCFRYADVTQNEGRYSGTVLLQPDPEGPHRYVTEVASGAVAPLDFTLYVPAGYGSLGGSTIPNVEETDDPARVLTASFAGGSEVW